MSTKEKNFSKRLLGLNPIEVENFINLKTNKYQKEIEVLTDKISELIIKKELIHEDLKTPRYSDNLIEYALSIIDNLDFYYEKLIRIECNKISEATIDKVNKYKANGLKLESKIGESRDSMKRMYNDIMKIVNKIDDPIVGTNTSPKSSGIIYMKDKQKKKIEKAEQIYNKITADGLSSDNSKGISLTDKYRDEIQNNISIPADVSKNTSNGFWDVSIDGLLTEYTKIPVIEDSHKIPEFAQPTVNENPIKSEMAETAYDEAAVGKSPEYSKALDAEIDQLRIKYIVGKLAGKDLICADGRKIIATGEKITPDVVVDAEKTGKLPELIINMKIPGMGD